MAGAKLTERECLIFTRHLVLAPLASLWWILDSRARLEHIGV